MIINGVFFCIAIKKKRSITNLCNIINKHRGKKVEDPKSKDSDKQLEEINQFVDDITKIIKDFETREIRRKSRVYFEKKIKFLNDLYGPY